MKVIKWISIVLLGLYLVFLSALYFNQEKLLFHPDKLPADFVFRDGFEEKVEVEENVNVSCLVLEKEHPDGLIIYLHGNKGSNRRCLKQAYQVDQGNNILVMPDYRGYGKSDGFMSSEGQAIDDVQKVYNHFVLKYKPKKITVVGYSMGSGMASYLAENNKVDHLFLVAPFTSLSDIKDMNYVPVPDFLLKYNFDTQGRIGNINCPITIFHSPDDKVVPYECSKMLSEKFPSKVNLITLNNVGHRGAIFADELREVIRNSI